MSARGTYQDIYAQVFYKRWLEVVYLFPTSVATDGGAREFFMDEKSERKRRIYTTFVAHPMTYDDGGLERHNNGI